MSSGRNKFIASPYKKKTPRSPSSARRNLFGDDGGRVLKIMTEEKRENILVIKGHPSDNKRKICLYLQVSAGPQIKNCAELRPEFLKKRAKKAMDILKIISGENATESDVLKLLVMLVKENESLFEDVLTELPEYRTKYKMSPEESSLFTHNILNGVWTARRSLVTVLDKLKINFLCSEKRQR